MAIGDAAAAKGLQVYASTQDRRLGYQNDNQRGDDVAAAMTRLDALEAFKDPYGAVFAGSTDANGNVTVSHNVGKVPSSIVITDTGGGAIPEFRKWLVISKTAQSFVARCYRFDSPHNGDKLANNPVEFNWVALV